LLIYGLINYLDSFCSNIFHLLRWKKRLLLSLRYMPILYFLFLGNFICCRHSYYSWQKELKYWNNRDQARRIIDTINWAIGKNLDYRIRVMTIISLCIEGKCQEESISGNTSSI
jgi:hypothetical protein